MENWTEKRDNWAQIEVDDGNNPSLWVPVVLTINKDLVFDTSEAQDPEKEIGDTALQTEGEFNVQVLQGEEIIAKKNLHSRSSLQNYCWTWRASGFR